ncbi:hypothetical protein GGR42_000867 [Saonia flava]|uniref:Uncharacterized protein n=1 Tax=Saonia flava TaxID=523696 RepID=A0A846QXP3_9FLAO|nr:hypothetical protein [Saonia flava]NJB70405.1 hypothetical protein [Saonia flava]
MNGLQSILSEIILLTNTIETDYPELYKFLDETPITIPSKNHPEIDKNAMKDYLESLKQLLEHHVETHQMGNGSIRN